MLAGNARWHRGAAVRKDMTMRSRRWLAGIGAGTLLLVGGVSAGSLTYAQDQTVTPATQVEANDADEHDPSYTASIQVPEQGGELSESDEAATLQSLATISSDQAAQAATAAYPGTTVMQVELDNENGWLVYSVELSNGSDVKVDAGNASVLATDQEDGQEHDEDESDGEEQDDDGQDDDSGESEVSTP